MNSSDQILNIFILIIGGLGIIAVWHAIKHINRYNGTETKALDYVLGKMRRTDTGEGGEEMPQENDGPKIKEMLRVQELLEGLSKETIIADRLALIGKMRESRVKVNMQILQQMTLAREATLKGLALPGYAASACMMLGLLGTVCGLTIMLQNMSSFQPTELSQITFDSWMESVKSIKGVMAGMRSGFNATIAGLVSSIGLSIFNQYLAVAQSKFMNKLDRATTEEILPATVPATEDESLLEQVSLQLEKSFSELSSLASENKETMDRVDAIRKGFMEIVDVVRQASRSDNTERVHGLVAQLSDVMDSVAGVSRSVIDIGDQMPKLLQQVRTDHSASISRVDRLINMYEQQRSLMQWPIHMKIVFGFMAALNLFLLIKFMVH